MFLFFFPKFLVSGKTFRESCEIDREYQQLDTNGFVQRSSFIRPGTRIGSNDRIVKHNECFSHRNNLHILLDYRRNQGGTRDRRFSRISHVGLDPVHHYDRVLRSRGRTDASLGSCSERWSFGRFQVNNQVSKNNR